MHLDAAPSGAHAREDAGAPKVFSQPYCDDRWICDELLRPCGDDRWICDERLRPYAHAGYVEPRQVSLLRIS